jgi:type IV fimbrial biogenesis protein FimT
MERIMNKQAGFTMIELAVTIAIVGILSAIAIPNGIAWISNSRVKSSARDIVSMIQRARTEAARDGAFVVVSFDPDGNGTFEGNYVAFVDDGEGTGDTEPDGILDGWADWVNAPTERTLVEGQLAAGVTIIAPIFTIGNGRTRFNSRGMPSFAGPVTLTNSSGHTITVRLASGGSVRVE